VGEEETMKLPVIEEFHTGDFTPVCPRQVLHKRLGQSSNVVETAWFRGSLAAHALHYIHKNLDWDANAAIVYGRAAWYAERVEQGLFVSESVQEHEGDLVEEVRFVLRQYVERLGGLLAQCEIIGSEVPVHLSFEITNYDKGMADYEAFSSHVDLIFRDTNNAFGQGEGRLVIWDHKFRDEAPSQHWIVRDQQAFIYTLAGKYGEFMLGEQEIWTAFNEWPAFAVVDLQRLKPYARKTVCKTTGEEFAAGDERPLERVLWWQDAREDREESMKRSLATSVQAMRLGLYPWNPGHHCRFCGSREWCERSDM
jgi:hypothetical protein